MNVQYFAQLRDVTHKDHETFSGTAATVGDVMRALSLRYGEKFSKFVMQDGQPHSLAIILVNGKDVRDGQHGSTPVHPEDDITIIPPVAGG